MNFNRVDSRRARARPRRATPPCVDVTNCCPAAADRAAPASESIYVVKSASAVPYCYAWEKKNSNGVD